MIYPTRRAILFTALGAPLALLLGLVAPGLWFVVVGWIAFALGLVLLDAVLGAPRQHVEAGVEAPSSLAITAEGEALAHVRFTRGFAPVGVELALEADPRLGVAPKRATASVDARRAGVVFRLEPTRRGEAALHRLWVRWRGPLGMVWKQTAAALEGKVAIVPNVHGVKQEAIRLFSRDAPFGQKVQLDRGEGSEFQALREFQTGMDPRTIDWKHSARHGSLVAKEFRTERNHPIVFAIDTGRLMCEPLGRAPRVDRAIDAALLLAYVGLKAGDRAGFFAFDARPRLSTGTVSGVGAFPLLQRQAAAIDYSAEETNYTLGLTQLAGQLERRSLVVVFTDFADTTSAELMIENLGRLLRRHLVLFVVFRDEELEALAADAPGEPDDVSRAVVADALLRERELVVARLRRMGVHVVDAPIERMGPALLDSYVDLKRRDLL